MFNLSQFQSLTDLDNQLKSKNIHVMVTDVCINSQYYPQKVTISIECVQHLNDRIILDEKVWDVIRAFDKAKEAISEKK